MFRFEKQKKDSKKKMLQQGLLLNLLLLITRLKVLKVAKRLAKVEEMKDEKVN